MASLCLYQKPKMGLFVPYKKITDPQTLALDVRETCWLIRCITALRISAVHYSNHYQLCSWHK